jgi:hypothetical protein
MGYTPIASRPRHAIARLRRRLLSLAVVGGAATLVTAAVIFAASAVTYDRYNAIVQQGSVSVDAAQNARADLLGNVGANADLLARSDQGARNQARATASDTWERFKNDLRVSWQSRGDNTYGEFAAFDAADRASTDYAADIGAMNAALDAGRQDDARAAFLGAYAVLNQRLLPALDSGLESDKVEFMESHYASASNTIRDWLIAVAAGSAVVFTLALAGLLLARQMHHRYTVELVLAALLAAGIGSWAGVQLRRADSQTRVLVRDAYDTVAGVRDEVALLDQQKALESIAIFDPTNAPGHFKEFDDLTTRFEQGLCGAQGCTQSSFLSASTAAPVRFGIPDPVRKQVLDNQDQFGLARVPLVANVNFGGEARPLEGARNAYLAYLAADRTLRSQVSGGNSQAALATEAGAVRAQSAATEQALGTAHDVARGVYASTWHSVEDAARIGEWLTIGVVAAALAIVLGLLRRRLELTPAGLR